MAPSPGQLTQKSALLPLAAVLGVFFFFQIFLLRNVSIAQYDESIFLDVARHIRASGLPLRSVGLDGRFYFEHLPGYVYLVGGLTALFGENVLLLRLVTMLFGAGSVSLTYLIALRAQDITAAFVAALLFALNSFFATYAFFVREETYFIFAILLAAYFLLRLQQTAENRYLLAAALSTAAALLFKEIALAFLLAAALYLLFVYPTWRARLAAALTFSLPTLVVLAAWLLWANRLDPAQLRVTAGRWTGAFGAQSAIVDPRIGLQARDWLETLAAYAFGWELVLLFFFALIYALIFRRRPAHIAILFLLYVFLAAAASLFMSLKEMRHLIAAIPAACLLIGLLLPWSSWWAWLTADRRRLLLAAPLALIFLISASPLKLTAADPAARWDPVYGDRLLTNDSALSLVKEAGDYLDASAPPGSLVTVIRQGPVIGFYANRPYIFLYPRPFDENMEILAAADYLVVDAVEFWQQSPQETETVMQYISDNFTVDQTLQNDFGQLTIYRSNSQ